MMVKAVVFIARIKNTTKTGVVALVIPETTILPTIEMADMIVTNKYLHSTIISDSKLIVVRTSN